MEGQKSLKTSAKTKIVCTDVVCIQWTQCPMLTDQGDSGLLNAQVIHTYYLPSVILSAGEIKKKHHKTCSLQSDDDHYSTEKQLSLMESWLTV